MEQYRNPFLMRAAENIESDETFINLFSSEPLSLLLDLEEKEMLWRHVTYVLSPPGAGKTSLMRFFSAAILRRVTDRNHILFNMAKKLNVKDTKNIIRCGAYLQIGGDYAFLEDDELFGKTEQKRLFFALLNARIILVTLKSIMQLVGINYSELNKVKYSPQEYVTELDGNIPTNGATGQDLLKWAGKVEQLIYKALNSFHKPDYEIPGNNSLFALEAMDAKSFSYDNHTLCDEFIFQFDDAHKFTVAQKKLLREEFVSHRIHGTLWLAERLEGLTTSEILEDSNKENRDYNVIRLDGNLPRTSFSTMVKAIAERRSVYSLSDVNLFSSLASDIYDVKDSDYDRAFDKSLKRVKRYASLSIYTQWFDAINKLESRRERALYMRSLLIFISRKNEASDIYRLFEYEVDEMPAALSKAKEMAIKIFEGESNIPHYYGEQNLIDLSSLNVEQFLDFSSILYGRLLAKRLTNPLNYELTAREQDELIRSHCKDIFDNVRKLPQGAIIHTFITNLINFARKETFSDSCSYGTVSGFAIAEENSPIGNEGGKFWFDLPQFTNLAEVLRLCLAFNILERNVQFQGTKNQKWTVFYLNQWICVLANIPFQRGGWRKQNLSTINNWLKK